MPLTEHAVEADINRVIEVFNIEQLSKLIPLSSRETWFGGFAGVTTTPVGTTAQIYVDIDKIKINALAPISLESQGQNYSVYIKPGVYEINRMFESAFYEPNNPDQMVAGLLNLRSSESTPTVKIVIDQNAARLNKTAEEEHCNDMIYTYNSTIGALYELQSSNISVDADTLSQFPEWARSSATVLDKFYELCKQTARRDQNRWHDFNLKPITEREAMAIIKAESLEIDLIFKPEKQTSAWLLLVQGSKMQVGVHPSDTVIDAVKF